MTPFYYVAGFLILSNFGLICSGIYFGGKIVWWFSKLDSRVETAKNTAIRAHKRIDQLSRNYEAEQSP